MIKHLLIHWKRKTESTRVTHCTSGSAHSSALRARCDPPARPIRAMTARDREARAIRLFCENVLDLLANPPKTHSTIPTVSYFVDKPLEQYVFAMAIPSGTRACTSAAALAWGGHASQTSPSPPPIASRCSPRRKLEALGGETVNGDAVPSSLHGDGLVPTTVAMFP